MEHLQYKIADLEDHSRRNNIKFRGIPESIPPNDLTNYMQCLMKALIPSLSDIEVDRAHRIPKPKFLPDTAPRDTLARIHYYHVKERGMAAAKRSPAVPEEFNGISLYADISQQTGLNRKKLAPLTKILRNNSIIYRWGFWSPGTAKPTPYTVWIKASSSSNSGNYSLQMRNPLPCLSQNNHNQNGPDLNLLFTT